MVMKNIEAVLVRYAGERCRSFEPGCACCDLWEAFDLGAYGAVENDIRDTRAFMCEWIACEPERSAYVKAHRRAWLAGRAGSGMAVEDRVNAKMVALASSLLAKVRL